MLWSSGGVVHVWTDPGQRAEVISGRDVGNGDGFSVRGLERRWASEIDGCHSVRGDQECSRICRPDEGFGDLLIN